MNVKTQKKDQLDFLEDTDELINQYKKNMKTKRVLLFSLFVLLILTVIFSTASGPANISPLDVLKVIVGNIFKSSGIVPNNSIANTVVMDLRLPRICLAIITGISLAVAGTVMQGIMRNPLVSPFTLGVSSGASFGAGIAIVLGTSIFGSLLDGSINIIIIINAFIFGLLTSFIVYGIASIKGTNPQTLVLAGVAISYLFSAAVSGMKYFSDNDELKELAIWLMGGLWEADWSMVGIIVLPVILGVCILMRYSWDLNVLSAGEEIAVNLGISINKLRKICLIICSLIASITIAFTGIIGFIGLLSPHIGRFFVGSDNRYLIPISGLIGANLLLISDTIARIVIAPTELPVGIITSLLGAPFFLYLLIKKKSF